MPLMQNPKFSHGELVKIRLDRCGANNKICYYAATETVRHKVKLEAEDIGIYLEELTYYFEALPKKEPEGFIQKIDDSWGSFMIISSSSCTDDKSPMYPEGTIIHKVLFGEQAIVFVGRHFLKRVKA